MCADISARGENEIFKFKMQFWVFMGSLVVEIGSLSGTVDIPINNIETIDGYAPQIEDYFMIHYEKFIITYIPPLPHTSLITFGCTRGQI